MSVIKKLMYKIIIMGASNTDLYRMAIEDRDKDSANYYRGSLASIETLILFLDDLQEKNKEIKDFIGDRELWKEMVKNIREKLPANQTTKEAQAFMKKYNAYHHSKLNSQKN